MPSLRDVLITISSETTGEKYVAKLYPSRDKNGDGNEDKYEVPVYKIYIKGVDDGGRPVVKNWSALRFTPFWNDPLDPVSSYKTRGFVVAGLSSFAKQRITNYVSGYTLHNTYSEYTGAIQLRGNFLIHAGPPSMASQGWGGAGCVEIIGDFNSFRNDIIALSGSKISTIPEAMMSIIKNRKLLVEMPYAARPESKYIGEF